MRFIKINYEGFKFMTITIRVTDSAWKPEDGQYKSMIVLTKDNWDDFGYKTSFPAYYCNEDGLVSELGLVKIYCEKEYNTEVYSSHTFYQIWSAVGEYITQLPETFCSLWGDLSEYEYIKRIFPIEYLEIFKRLNDIAIYPELREKFINDEGMKASLLRSSGTEKALNEASVLLKIGEKIAKDISFNYLYKPPYCCNTEELSFNFKKDPYLPYRINILIGKNGVGKTNFLTELSNSLSGLTEDENPVNRFTFRRPPIDKVMSISYSAFDSFKKPPKSNFSDNTRKMYSYVYCGIQSENGTLSLEDLKRNFKYAFSKISERNRLDIWKDVISELLETEHNEVVEKLISGNAEINWSSGQHIIISTITELIANIENESIILFDEPEIHLHPNAISNLMRMFCRLLEKFDSYAIFSTHSPIIIQEIPYKNIQIMERNDSELIVRKPNIECFGENISSIITDVFDISSKESNYKSIFKKLGRSLSEEEIASLFSNGLSLNALIYLKNCIKFGDE